MPIEVRELIIKATVTQDSNEPSKTAGSEGKSSTQELIKTCVEKVIEILKERNGR